jgi:hypothetical protein
MLSLPWLSSLVGGDGPITRRTRRVCHRLRTVAEYLTTTQAFGRNARRTHLVPPASAELGELDRVGAGVACTSIPQYCVKNESGNETFTFVVTMRDGAAPTPLGTVSTAAVIMSSTVNVRFVGFMGPRVAASQWRGVDEVPDNGAVDRI